MEHLIGDLSTNLSCDSTNIENSLGHLKLTADSDHHDALPYNWSQTGGSSDESGDIGSDEEEDGELGEDRVIHSGTFAEGDPENCCRIKADDVGAANVVAEKTLVDSEEESDYEEPKKVNNAPQSSAENGEKAVFATTAEDVPLEKTIELDAFSRCLKCDELINSDEKVVATCPRFHANCLRCARCNCLITDFGFQLIGDAPYCRTHSTYTAEEEQKLPVKLHDDCENSMGSSSQSIETDNQNGQGSHRGSPPRSDDVLPPTGLAKRLVEQWSNIETLKTIQNTSNAVLSDSAQYAPNTAKIIAARFSDGSTDCQRSPKPTASVEPTEQWPTQGQARGLINKFSAMQA